MITFLKSCFVTSGLLNLLSSVCTSGVLVLGVETGLSGAGRGAGRVATTPLRMVPPPPNCPFSPLTEVAQREKEAGVIADIATDTGPCSYITKKPSPNGSDRQDNF